MRQHKEYKKKNQEMIFKKESEITELKIQYDRQIQTIKEEHLKQYAEYEKRNQEMIFRKDTEAADLKSQYKWQIQILTKGQERILEDCTRQVQQAVNEYSNKKSTLEKEYLKKYEEQKVQNQKLISNYEQEVKHIKETFEEKSRQCTKEKEEAIEELKREKEKQERIHTRCIGELADKHQQELERIQENQKRKWEHSENSLILSLKEEIKDLKAQYEWKIQSLTKEREQALEEHTQRTQDLIHAHDRAMAEMRENQKQQWGADKKQTQNRILEKRKNNF